MELISSNQGIELVHQEGNWLLKKEHGFSPVELLVASIAGCSAYVYEQILTNSQITFETKGISVTYERAEEKPAKPLEKVLITFSMNMSKKAHGKAERALRLIAKNCPVIQSLDSEIKIIERVIFL